MSREKKSSIQNIKNICSDLGQLFEQMEAEAETLQQEFDKKVQDKCTANESTFSKLKQQLADLS